MDSISVAGNLASIFGLLVSFFAFLKARGAKKAAEEARNEASEVVNRIVSRLIASDVKTALECSKGLQEACRGRNWPRALERCQEIRERLSALRQSGVIDSKDGLRASQYSDDLHVIQSTIESIRAERKALDLTGDRRNQIDKIVNFLAGIEARLRVQDLRIE